MPQTPFQQLVLVKLSFGMVLKINSVEHNFERFEEDIVRYGIARAVFVFVSPCVWFLFFPCPCRFARAAGNLVSSCVWFQSSSLPLWVCTCGSVWFLCLPYPLWFSRGVGGFVSPCVWFLVFVLPMLLWVASVPIVWQIRPSSFGCRFSVFFVGVWHFGS